MSGKLLDTQNGEFIRIKVDGDHLTIWIEGRDQDGPSVSGTALTGDKLDEFIAMLMVYRVNHFGVRNSRKADRRQSDRTEKKLQELNNNRTLLCSRCGRRPGPYNGWCGDCQGW